MSRERHIVVVGAGLGGPLMALLLARRGFAVTLLERRADPRGGVAQAGRSINLALCARGIRPLERAGVFADVEPLLMPMRARRVHPRSGPGSVHPYGQRPGEINYSVGRAALNRVLVSAAERAGVMLRFEHRCLGLEPESRAVQCIEARSGRAFELDCETVIAADGAGSAVRASLAAAGACTVCAAPLDHDYKEMTLPALGGTHALEPDVLHVWPRGGFMLIALPNSDGTFTLTLFLPRTGEPSFAALADAVALRAFFGAQFPDLEPYQAALIEDLRHNPQGQLGTVYVRGWHLEGRALLLGDAAHAIVPFHGQGMNAAFEDCAVLDTLLERGGEWAAVYAEFERLRRPSAAAIARMALENYAEMRASVREADFQRCQRLGFELERRFPERFIPRYSMVMFHPEISYREARRRGAIQAAIIEQLDRARAADGGIDYALAARLVHERLPVPIGRDPDARTG